MTYKSPYAANLGKMQNSEITGLAKNRFTDEETMLAISKHHYRLGKEYLSSNPNITQEAAKELWNHRGYVFKATLLSNGAIKLKKKEYAEVYHKYFKNNRRSHYRMMQAFFGGYYWQRQQNSNNTPTDLLEEIYADLPEDEQMRSYTLERFINHQNCSLNLALRISTMPDPPEKGRHYYHTNLDGLRQKALLKVAEITKRDGVDAR
jgi:hypothetical protein